MHRGNRTYTSILIGRITNAAILDLYSRRHHVIHGYLARILRYTLAMAPVALRDLSYYSHPFVFFNRQRADYHVYENFPPVLDRRDVERYAHTSDGSWTRELSPAGFVCLALKDRAYDLRRSPREVQAYPTMYSDPLDFRLVLGSLHAAQMSVVRVGVDIDPFDGRLHCASYVDYAANHRTPTGDLWCAANCSFAIVDTAGFWWFALAFDRPSLITNSVSWDTRPFRSHDKVVPVRYWSRSDRRFLCLSECLAYSFKIAKARTTQAHDLEMIRADASELQMYSTEMLRSVRNEDPGTDVEHIAQLRHKMDVVLETAGLGGLGVGYFADTFLLTNESLIK